MEFLKGLNSLLIYALGFGIAFGITLFVTPLSKKFAIKVGAMAEIKDRSMHTKPMPLAGGTAIVLGFVVAVLFLVPTTQLVGYSPKAFMGLLTGSLIITVLGLLDDIYDLNAKIKFFFQILAALIVVYTGTTINNVTWPFILGGVLDFGAMNKMITIIWIIGVTNAVNFMDGLDGLATGVASIASICLMFISILYGQPVVALYAAILAGSCLGFLPHNFNPAKIFMGDTGSTFLGFVLAVISIKGLIKGYTALTLVIAIIVLGLPIFDTSFAIVRRLMKGQSPTQADRGHVHHRLVDKGFSHRKSVIILYGISGCFGIVGILIAMNDLLLAAFVIAFVIFVWLVDFIVRKFKKSVDPVETQNEE